VVAGAFAFSNGGRVMLGRSHWTFLRSLRRITASSEILTVRCGEVVIELWVGGTGSDLIMDKNEEDEIKRGHQNRSDPDKNQIIAQRARKKADKKNPGHRAVLQGRSAKKEKTNRGDRTREREAVRAKGLQRTGKSALSERLAKWVTFGPGAKTGKFLGGKDKRDEIALHRGGLKSGKWQEKTAAYGKAIGDYRGVPKVGNGRNFLADRSPK